MNDQIPRTRTGRLRWLCFAAFFLLALPAVGAAAVGADAASRESAGTLLVPPLEPGFRAPGLRYFRLDPAVRDTVYRLLVVPVQFPEDRILGGGSRDDLEAKLNGAVASLARYYFDQTGGRLRVESTLAPTVIAPHDRDTYTVDGGGYGNDPGAYPNNAQGLVEEVTGLLDTRIDFRRYDNTGDGIADGLLVLHSGPRSAESGVRLDPDVLVAHAFTVPTPLPRGGGTVFPYAVAATRDGLGIWAHELGHLLGLADLYVASGICPGPGVGEWSLMATGSNRENGENPTGLDAFSRQTLGLVPEFDRGVPVDLASGSFLRVSEPGLEEGPRYYLVEKRASGDGPAGQTPARVVYFVDEEAVDNRSCPLPADTYRPMVRVAGVICPGDSLCSESFQEACPPGPGPEAPRCLPVALHFESDVVRTTYGIRPPVRIARIGLSVPRSDPAMQEQRAYLSLENVDRARSQTVSLAVLGTRADSVCVLGPTSWERTLAPGETAVDSSLTLVPCSFLGALPREEVRIAFGIASAATSSSRVDTLVLPAGEAGLLEADWPRFSIRNLEPDRRSPWDSVDLPEPGPCEPDCPPGLRIYTVRDPDRLAHGELLSPWFLVPPDGRLVLHHAWDLEALSPDIALDAGQVRLRAQGRSDVVLTPPGGWGFSAERSIGNALGGLEVLSGSGARPHVFDLSAHAGEVARLVCMAAGDADPGRGEWTLEAARAYPAPAARFDLEEDPTVPGRLRARAMGSFVPGVLLQLFQGRPATHPVALAESREWDGSPWVDLGDFEGERSRFELLWTDSAGASDGIGSRFDLPHPRASSFLLSPRPNPLPAEGMQTWTLRVGDADPRGTYGLRVFTVTGGLVWQGSVRIDVAGTRLVLWDGRDEEGRAIPNGVYFLEARRPDGAVDGARIVVLR